MNRFANFAIVINRVVVILVVLAFTLPAALILAQEGEIALVPFTDQEMGFSGVGPEGWMVAQPGVYRRLNNETDLTALIESSALGFALEDITAGLLQRLGQTALPEEATVLEANTLTWNIYRFDVPLPTGGAVAIDLALAESPYSPFIVLLQTQADEHDALYDALFLPVVEALQPFSLNWAQPEPVPFAPLMEPERLQPEVLNTRPHDVTAYTQGLLLYDGSLYESAGLYGESTLREVNPDTGEVIRSVPVPAEYFAEGLALVGDRLIQLTWKEHEALVYDLETFERVDTIPYEGEGWGLCYDGEVLYMSNGSPFITIRDAETFAVIDRGLVTVAGQPVDQLNELECVGDYLYANIYQADFIVKIDKHNGNVVAIINAAGLLSPEERAALVVGQQVLNGIVYLPESDTFLITGKQWPTMFEVRFVPMPEATPAPEATPVPTAAPASN